MNPTPPARSNFGLGLLFVTLWASASSATKIGLQSSQPLVLALIRFGIACIIMLGIAHLVMRQPLPSGKKVWRQLMIYGCLNVGLYLGLYVVAMQEVSAGLGSLFIAINPVLILLISTIWYRQPLKPVLLISFLLCIGGMFVAAHPLLIESYATTRGIILLFLCNVSYSFGAIYFAKKNWHHMHLLTINGWQTLFGGILLLPFLLYFFDSNANHFTTAFWGAALWLAIPTSIVAVWIWISLLRDNPTKAASWLFLCPVAGFGIAALVMKEPLTWHTYAGAALVITGLYLVQKIKLSRP